MAPVILKKTFLPVNPNFQFEESIETALTAKGVHHLWSSFYLAEEMGKGLE